LPKELSVLLEAPQTPAVILVLEVMLRSPLFQTAVATSDAVKLGAVVEVIKKVLSSLAKSPPIKLPQTIVAGHTPVELASLKS